MLSVRTYKPGSPEWLHQAINISLFTDARASADQELPDGSADRRGFWGDYELPEDESLGSLLWTLRREKMTDDLVKTARGYIEQALTWLQEERWIVELKVSTWRVGDRLYFTTRSRLPDGKVITDDWSDKWEASISGL